MKMENREIFEETEDILAQINPLLEGKEPEVIAAVVVNLMATFMAGHHPQIRDATRALTQRTCRVLEDVIVDELIEAGTVDPEWRQRLAH